MENGLAAQIAILERQVRALRILLLAVVSGAILLWLSPVVRGSSRPDSLRLRSLAIVDEHGVTRLLLGAPLPNPISGGKESQRRSRAYGMLIYDAKGNEFGGYTISDDGALVSCFDWAHGEATCKYAMPSGEAGFEVNAPGGTPRGSLELSPDGNVSLTLNDSAHRTRVRFAVSADGNVAFQKGK
jgi:hypothetical protein